MTITLPDEAVEMAAKAIHDHWQGDHSHSRSWAQTVEKLPGQANDFRAKARAAITAYLDALVQSGRAVKTTQWWSTFEGNQATDPKPVLIIRLDGET